MTHAIIVKHPNQLTTGWAQHIVNQQMPTVKVANSAITSVDVGTTTRVRLTIDHNGPSSLARQWFVKLPSLSWRARLITALPRLLPTEVNFYRALSASVPLIQPTLLAGASQFGKGALLVLNDVREQGAIPGKTSDTYSANQATLVVKALARCHATFWHKAEFDANYQWLNGPVRSLEDKLGSALAVPLMQLGLQRAGKSIPFSLHAPALNYARQRKQMMAFLANGPKTLIHHDCHPGNLFWQNGQPGFLDWQMVRIGEGISDVAYFLATALDVETRRQHEIELLTTYYQTLTDHDIRKIDLDHLHQRYRAHLTYPFEAMVVTLAIGNLMDLTCNLKFIERAAQAIEDHNAFSALPA